MPSTLFDIGMGIAQFFDGRNGFGTSLAKVSDDWPRNLYLRPETNQLSTLQNACSSCDDAAVHVAL